MAIEVIVRGSIALFSGDRLIEARGLAAKFSGPQISGQILGGGPVGSLHRGVACDFLGPQGSLDSLAVISVAVGRARTVTD